MMEVMEGEQRTPCLDQRSASATQLLNLSTMVITTFPMLGQFGLE
jgi:hypothetical protein